MEQTGEKYGRHTQVRGYEIKGVTSNARRDCCWLLCREERVGIKEGRREKVKEEREKK